MRREERLIAGLHDPLSRRPGPVLTALMRAFARGLDALDLRAAQRAMYLGSARGPWMTEWAELYSYVRGGRDDAELLAAMRAQTILERRKTTHEAVTAALSAALGGLPVLVMNGDERVYRLDDVAALLEGRYAYDYTSLYLSEQFYDNVPDSHRGARGAQPWSPGYGPSGLWIVIGALWTPEREAAALEVLERHVKAGGGFELGWAITVKRKVHDELSVEDATTHPPMGWGIDVWGGSTWG